MASLLALPSPGRITNPYSASHRGIDFGWGNGTSVYAAASGTISYDWTAGYGHRLTIDHGSLIGQSTLTKYAHLASMKVKSGKVVKGQLIATEGNSGTFAEFIHLHFELLVGTNGREAKVNPSPFFADSSGNEGTPIMAITQADVNSIWRDMTVNRSGTAVTAIQELADAKSGTIRLEAKLAAIENKIDAISLTLTPGDRQAIINGVIAGLAGAGGFTAADRAMLDDIASKGELTQALTSTVQLINQHTTEEVDGITLTAQ